ncbi:hypothetical protein ACQ4PT_016201 [Festuca glaucescens]
MQVFWPLDDDWYKGAITAYTEPTKKHSVKYDDDEAEDLTLADERMKFFISSEEMKCLNLKFGISNLDKKGYDELLALAVSFHDYQGLDPGDLVWAKITGHAMWPAVVVDESDVPAKRAMKPVRFLLTQQLPESMLQLRKSIEKDGSDVNCQDDALGSCDNLSEDRAEENEEDAEITQIELGNLRVSKLGRIVSDSDHFHNKMHIWPEGYTAFRKFTSVKDPHLVTSYKMEVLRNSDIKARPLFRVTSEDGLQELPNARSCLKYFENGGDTLRGYRAFNVNWKDLDYCNVCDMDELEDDDNANIHLMLLAEDEDPCIRLLSYCKKHRQPSTERPPLESDLGNPAQVIQADAASSSGCARTGKSRIHGFGVFAKVAHKAGDMMIEYIGELVRPPISDIRERRIYNSLVLN